MPTSNSNYSTVAVNGSVVEYVDLLSSQFPFSRVFVFVFWPVRVPFPFLLFCADTHTMSSFTSHIQVLPSSHPTHSVSYHKNPKLTSPLLPYSFTSSSSTNSTPLPSSTNLNTDKSSVKQKFLENRRLQGFLQDAGDKRSAERSVLGLGRDGMEMERERARGLDTGEMRKVMGEELRGWGRWFEDAGRRESR
jgi:hypothetical protein